MNKFLLSIIIPAYNAAPYLEKCISSALAVNIKDKEIIIVNDGSSDVSEKIICGFKKMNDCIKYICQENKGPGAARNAGLEIAKGKYVFFLDSDDSIKHRSMERVLKIAQDTDADAVHFDIMYYQTGLDGIQKYGKSPSNDAYYAPTFPETNLFVDSQYGMILGRNKFFNSQPARYVFKRDIITEKGLKFDTSIRYYEEVLFTQTLLLKIHTLIYVPVIVYERRYRPNSIFTSSNREYCFTCNLALCNKLYPFLQEYYSDVHKKEYIVRFIKSRYDDMLGEMIRTKKLSKLKRLFFDLIRKKEIYSRYDNKISLFFRCIFPSLYMLCKRNKQDLNAINALDQAKSRK